MEEEDHYTHKKINEISDKQIGSFFFSGGVGGETAAV
jgi:hypothetical protein